MPEEGKLQKLVGGEFVRVELFGTLDSPEWWSVAIDVIFLLIGGAGGTTTGRAAHVGVTARELLIAELGLFGKLNEVRRIPLEKVKVVKASQGMLTDQLILEVGDPKTLKLQVAVKQRELTQQLIEVLGGAPQEERATAAAQ